MTTLKVVNRPITEFAGEYPSDIVIVTVAVGIIRRPRNGLSLNDQLSAALTVHIEGFWLGNGSIHFIEARTMHILCTLDALKVSYKDLGKGPSQPPD